MTESTPAEPVEFQDDNVHVVLIHKPACRIEMRVKVSPAIIGSARREAVKAVNKEVVLPGFRKGRAPDEMVLKKFRRDVEKETHSKLAEAAFTEAQKLSKTPLLNNNAKVTFDLQKLSDEGAELVFSFETEPSVPSVDPKRFEPKAFERPQVTEKEINEAIQQMQFFFAEWKAVENRPVQEKDYLLIDLDAIEDDETVQRVFTSVRFEVSKERMAEWMQKLVLGANVGDVLEGTSEPDAGATEEEKREFKPKKVRLTILQLEEASLPELNDEFAKKVGAKDVDAMRQLVTDMLNRQLDEKARDTLREQVNDFLIEQYAFEIPQSLTMVEKEHRQRQLFQNPAFRRDWEKMSQEERKSHDEHLTDESTHAVRLFYVSRQIVRNANIGITHKEIQDEAVATLRSHGQQIPVDQIPKEVYALALSKVILAHAQDYIIRAQKES